MLTLDQVLAVLQTLEWSDYAAAGLSIFALSKALRYLFTTKDRLPPSFQGEPILGHARLILSDQSYKKYADRGKTLGEILII